MPKPIPPAAPTYLAYSLVGPSSVSLSWIDSSNNEDGFEVQRYSNGTWSKIATLPTNTASYLDAGLTAGAVYQYRVRAYRKSPTRYSDWSNVVEVAPFGQAPSPFTVSALASCDGDVAKVMLNWTPSVGAVSYAVLKNGVGVANGITVLQYEDRLVTLGPNTYVVTASNPYGHSDSEASVIVPDCTSPVPIPTPTAQTPVDNVIRNWGDGLLAPPNRPWKVACLLLRFSDATPEQQPMSREWMERFFFWDGPIEQAVRTKSTDYPFPAFPPANQVSINQELREMSYGILKLIPTYVGPITLPIAATGDMELLMPVVWSECAKQGVYLDEFDAIVGDIASPKQFPLPNLPEGHYLYGQPMDFLTWGGKSPISEKLFWQVGYCAYDYAGVFSLNGTGFLPWPATFGYAHLFGHALGFYESTGWIAGAGVTLDASGQGYVRTYFDQYSAMGVPLYGDYSGREKEWMGWVQPSRVLGNGTYRIEPLSLASSKTKILQVPAGDQLGWYYIELRRQVGIDRWQGNSAAAVGPVIYYIAGGGTYYSMPNLLDMSPAPVLADPDLQFSFANTSFAVGQVFVDPWNGMKIKCVSATASEAVIEISGMDAGDTEPPTVAIDYPSNGETLEAGTVMVQGRWSDNRIVHTLEFLVDGVVIRKPDPNPGFFPFTPNGKNDQGWNPNPQNGAWVWKATSGNHRLTLRAYDTRNSSETTVEVTIT